MTTATSDRWPHAWRQGETVSPHLQRVHRTDALTGIAAPAKLNLGLAVVGRRTDGYHKLVTLFVTLALADTVRVEPAATLTLTLIGDNPALTTGNDNLCLRAARALQTATGTPMGARISLTKRIPVAAGLGGGSSDAAATLRALDALWDTRVPDIALLALARSLGADVPFFLCGNGAVMARGIGDLLWPAVPVSPMWAVLVVPKVDIPRKTVALYGALTEAEYDRGEAVGQQMTVLRSGKTPNADLLGNSFLAPLERLAPVVTATRQAMIAAGLFPALSGSGPTLYALCSTEAEAIEAASRLHGLVDARILVTSLK